LCFIFSLVTPQGTGTMEETLGQYLCHMRTQKGVSLEDISKATRIDPRYLQAVEENDFSQLPRAEVFAKAYVKAYARCLSLEEAEVLRRFAESAGSFYTESSEAICEVARKNTQKVFPESWLTRLCSSFRTLL
jgi:cytoskeletal protein RodZ